MAASVMCHQPAKFGGVASWPANLWKGLEVEGTLKTQMIFSIVHGVLGRSI